MEMYKYGSRITKWEPLSVPATVQVSGARHSSEPAVIPNLYSRNSVQKDSRCLHDSYIVET